MTLTLNEIQSVVPELDAVLAHGRLTDAWLEDDETIIITVRQGSVEHDVLICTRMDRSRIHLTGHGRGGGRERRRPSGSLADALRRLSGAVIEGVRPMFHDRVVEIGLLDSGGRSSLLFECTGRHPNLFLLDSRGIIRNMLKPTHSQKRDLRPGRRYARPLRRDPDPFASMRFMGDGAGISAQIEAHYDRKVTGTPGRWVSVEPPARRGRKRN